jgi:hypothetical protein
MIGGVTHTRKFVTGYRVVMLVAAALALLIERKKRARGASAESMASAALTRLDAESPAEKQREVEDAVSS